MAFGNIDNGFQLPLFDFGAAFVRTALAGARPTFELQFFNAQNAQLDALDREIAEIRANVDTSGATALLTASVADLERNLEQIGDFKTRTDARIAKLTLTIEQLNELGTLADPSTVAEFDAKLAETILTVERTEARAYEFFGVNDKVRAHKQDALARLQAISHNGFATQTDIDNVLAELDTIRGNYLTSQQIASTNASLAYTVHASNSSRLTEIKGRIAAINIEANAEAVEKIQERRDHYSEVLSILSLAFEGAQEITRFVAENTVLPRRIEPGSVLNLFS
jgi:multidrug resistance efflux pump